MKSKGVYIFGLVFLFAIIAFSSGALAVDYQNKNITFVNLANGGIIHNGTSFSINITNATGATTGFYIENCTLFLQSASTNLTSWYKAGQVNNTNSYSTVVINFNPLMIQDSNDYIINATCWNSTASTMNVTYNLLTGIIFDSSVPTAPTLSPSDGNAISSETTQTFTGTVVDANTTGCSGAISRGGGTSDSKTFTTTYSASTCSASVTFSDSTDNGNWYWYMTATDGSNSTSSSPNLLSVQIPGTSGGLPPETVSQITGSNTMYWIIGAVILVFVLWIIFKR